MSFSKNMLIKPVILFILLFASIQPSFAEKETLVLQHFLSPKSTVHTDFIAPWVKNVEQQSGGDLKIEVFPSMALGGKAPELYRQVRDGVADIIWTLIGYTPGVFPRSEVFELPSVHNGSARITTESIQKMFDLVADDFKDIKVILLHVHQGNALHMRQKNVTNIKDLKGLKLRTPSRTGAWMIEQWNAEPVGMPVPALPQALSKGTVDGALLPMEVVPALKAEELTVNSIEGINGERFGTAVFLFAMNKDSYNNLPQKLKTVIDNNSGANIATEVSTKWGDREKNGRDAQINSGGKIIHLTSEAVKEFEDRAKIVEKRWIEEMNNVNIDGQKLVDTAKKLIHKN